MRFIPDEKIFAAVFEKLEKLGLQSDENFAESFVRGHPNWGRRRLEIELKRRGIEEELIETFLPTDISEIENARETLAKKLRGEKVPNEYSAKQKLAAFLARRGFSLDVIREVIGF